MKLNTPETSLRVFGIYLIVVPALGLLFMPEFVFRTFGLSHGSVLWLPRMIGVLAGVIGVIEIVIARYRLQPLYIWTVWLRYFAAACMVAFVLTGEAERGLLLFAAIDALGATWTLATLRGSRAAT